MPEEKDLSGQESKEENVEEKAKDMGWKPKEEFDGEEGGWVSAREFVDRQPIYERIHKLNKSNKDLRQTVHDMKSHLIKKDQYEYNKYMNDLDMQKKYAIESSDSQKVSQIDERMRAAPSPQQDPMHPAVESFVAENAEWWSDEELQDYAVSRHSRMIQKSRESGKQLDMEESLNQVLSEVKARFPDHEAFHNGNRDRAHSVEGGRPRSSRGKKRYTESDLSSAQRDIANRFVRQGAFKSIQQYVNELASIGELE